MICFTVAEKLDRELFTTSILFTFFQTFPGRLERDVTMAIHIAISFANISYSAQAQVYDSLLITTLMCNQFPPGLPKQLESVKVNIGCPVVRTDGGRSGGRCSDT